MTITKLMFLTVFLSLRTFAMDLFEELTTPASALLELSSQEHLLNQFIKKLHHHSLTLSDVLEMQTYYDRLGGVYEEGHKKEGQRITMQSITDDYHLPNKHCVYYCCDPEHRIGERVRSSNGRKR